MKTLKEINPEHENTTLNVVFRESLRQEAKKWIEYLEKRNQAETGIDLFKWIEYLEKKNNEENGINMHTVFTIEARNAQIRWIKSFFNIQEAN